MNPSTDPASEKSRVLRARAEALARAPLVPPTGEVVLEVIAFGLAHERYALEASFVREIGPLEDLTPLPCTPPFVRGLVNVRGRLLPVIDLKRFFDLPDPGITDLHRILFVESSGLAFGLLADTVLGVCHLPLSALQPAPPTLTGIRADYLRGVTAERLIVLDGARILADRRIVVHEDVDL